MDEMDGRDEGACRAPGAITPEALLAHATERPDPAVAAHLAACPSCAATAADDARLDRLLRAKLSRAACPAPLLLGEFALDLLSPHETRAVRDHLAVCLACAREVGEVERAVRGDRCAEVGCGGCACEGGHAGSP